MIDTLICPHCQGTGRIDMRGRSGVYFETLKILRRQRSFVVANRDCAKFGCKPTALNNRLEWLERHGLARSERYGRERRFYAADRESEPSQER